MIMNLLSRGLASTPALALMAMAVLCVFAGGCAPGAKDTRIQKFESSLLPAFAVEGEPEQVWTLSERMAHWKVPGMSIAVIRDGKIAWAKGYGVLQSGREEKVDVETVFSVGSVSKVGAAATTLRLVDERELDLGRNVNDYLTRWKVPDSSYTEVRPVTLRGILSHTAGLSVSGFPDFQPDAEAIPDLLDVLEGRAPARTKPVRVVYAPGSKFEYSGGGTTVEQLVIEEVTGVGFAEAARRRVFEPLGMNRSTYESPLPPDHGNIAKAHGREGEPRALPRGYETMPEQAASGLWSTPTDLARLVIALIESYQGNSGGFLSQDLAREMMTEVWPSGHGLGPELEGTGLDRRFSHGGSNDSYKAHIEGHPNTGNGLVILTNGANGKKLIAEVRRAVAVAEGWSPALSNHMRIKPVKLSPAEIQGLVGVYQDKGGLMKRTIDSKDGVLLSAVQAGGYPMIPVDSARFLLESGDGPPDVIKFARNYDGRIQSMFRERGPGVIQLEKVEQDHDLQ